jgi:hypothetical protein
MKLLIMQSSPFSHQFLHVQRPSELNHDEVPEDAFV